MTRPEILFKAVETGKAGEVEKTLAIEKLNATTYYGVKSIMLAAESQNITILQLLLENSKTISRESFWRRTANFVITTAIRANNTEMLKLLLNYGVATNVKSWKLDRKNETIKMLLRQHGIRILKASIKSVNHFKKNKIYIEEDGIIIQKKHSKLTTIDEALEKNNWKLATTLLERSIDTDVDFYTECLKKMFLKATYLCDTEKVKFYLEKLIENAVGVLTDETGKSTLEIALENPADLIQILSNYGFHENSLHHAYKCLIDN